MPDRSGKRKTREQLSKRRIPELGYYFIVTDTKETEQNYMRGLRDSIPKDLQGKIVIKVCEAKTVELVSEAINMASLQPQYGEPWIVFDRDQVKDFDRIISTALKNGINVGWSNPCIGFAQKFAQVTGQKYDKADKAIYQKLCRFGDEQQAINIAQRKLDEHTRDGTNEPSKMCPCTTVHVLIEEIAKKVTPLH